MNFEYCRDTLVAKKAQLKRFYDDFADKLVAESYYELRCRTVITDSFNRAGIVLSNDDVSEDEVLNFNTALDRDVWEKRRKMMLYKYYDSLSVKDMEIVTYALTKLSLHNLEILNTLCDLWGRVLGVGTVRCV